MRRLALIGTNALWRLSLKKKMKGLIKLVGKKCLGYLLMRIIASFLRYTGYLNFINDAFYTISSSCTTTQLSILLTYCLTAIKNHVIKYCTTAYESNGKVYFGPLKIQVGFLIILKIKRFSASSLHMISLLSILRCLIIP